MRPKASTVRVQTVKSSAKLKRNRKSISTSSGIEGGSGVRTSYHRLEIRVVGNKDWY